MSVKLSRLFETGENWTQHSIRATCRHRFFRAIKRAEPGPAVRGSRGAAVLLSRPARSILFSFVTRMRKAHAAATRLPLDYRARRSLAGSSARIPRSVTEPRSTWRSRRHCREEKQGASRPSFRTHCPVKLTNGEDFFYGLPTRRVEGHQLGEASSARRRRCQGARRDPVAGLFDL